MSAFQSLYPAILKEILEAGEEVSPRGQKTRELVAPHLYLPDARYNLVAYHARKLNYYFSVAEWLWILLGQNDVSSIGRFNSKIADYSDDGVTFTGAYGPKITEQLPYVLGKLIEDPDTRQAVISIWRERPGQSKDVPCTVALQYLRRGGKLHSVTFMRSNDAWLGLPYDVFNFTQLQAYVAAALDLEVGSYSHLAGSLHLYEWSWEKARAVVEEAKEQEDEDASWLVSPGVTYPLPLQVRGIFNGLAQPELKSGLSKTGSQVEKICQTAGTPWAEYLQLLAHRTIKDTRLTEPWGTLVGSYGVAT